MSVNVVVQPDKKQVEQTKPRAHYEVPKITTIESAELLKALGPAHTRVEITAS